MERHWAAVRRWGAISKEARAGRYSWRWFMRCLGIGALTTFVMAGLALAASPEPRPVIEELNATLLEVMQDADRLGYPGRYERLEPVLEESFNFPFMVRVAVGGAWRDLTEEEQARLTGLFTEMSIATFAARFDGHGGEWFEIVAEGQAPRDAVLIETRIVEPADKPVSLSYVLKPFDGRWRIIDIFAESKFSELARQRAEFGGVLRGGGVRGLLATLQQKIGELSDEG